MEDRAEEALVARRAISAQDGINANQIGFLGFSQAGWVLPRVANQITPAFTVIVGGAVSWRDQGTYYSRIRMMSEGVPQEEIEQRLADRILRNDALFATPAAQTPTTDMDTARFRFVVDAYWEDTTDMISGMMGPVLAIWGEDDLNVDAYSDSDRLAARSRETSDQIADRLDRASVRLPDGITAFNIDNTGALEGTVQIGLGCLYPVKA